MDSVTKKTILENFTNNTIDTAQLPRFEEVQFTLLHKNYWKVLLVSYGILFAIIGVALTLLMIFAEDVAVSENRILLPVMAVIIMALVLFFSRIGFRKKGFAFREHDVLYRHGIIATTTIIIPYNRVQHVSLHEGLVSRYFGLAKIEIFTAGGSSSDIEIPGIPKEEAENIKQLLMGKIQKKL